MAEEDDRDTGVLLFGDVGELLGIVTEDEALVVVRTEVTEGILVVDGQAVAEVVVTIDSDAVFGEPSCHPVIAVDVLRHTVDDLHNSLHRAFRLPGNGMDVGISDDGREREFFFQNWHCNNLLNICHRR